MSRSRPWHRRAAGTALAAVAMVSACYDLSGPGACTLEARAGIVVDLRTEAGRTLSAEDATGRAVDGGEIANLEPFFDQLIGAWEQPGTYEVMVEKPGFEPWIRGDVRVEPGQCHVTPARLEAVLTPHS